jgi:hypothetical protein
MAFFADETTLFGDAPLLLPLSGRAVFGVGSQYGEER